jgi:micrococcal nuclease
MVKDVSDRDRFGRLLRYLYAGEVFVNEEMVRAGLAIAKRYEPDTSMAEILEAAQAGAEQAALGLFSSSLSSSTTTTVRPTTTSTVRTTASTTAQPVTTTAPPVTTTAPPANCDPSYPDVCIPPPPPDLDCGDISPRNFRVLPPDPHGFDGNDNDGYGCES